MTTIERLEKLFVEKLELNKDLLKPETTLDSLGLDSLDKIELLFQIEDEFKIKIPERDAQIATLKDVVEMIDRLTAEQQGKEQV